MTSETPVMYVAWICSDGHTSPLFVYPMGSRVERPSECQHPIRHVAKDKLDIGFALVDRPVAVWFPKRGDSLPWMSMMRSCGCKFVDYHVAPEGAIVDVVIRETMGTKRHESAISSTSASMNSIVDVNDV